MYLTAVSSRNNAVSTLKGLDLGIIGSDLDYLFFFSFDTLHHIRFYFSSDMGLGFF